MNSTKKKAGRKTKPFHADWLDRTIDGLVHQPDGRWRIAATGERFTEPDERLAVARFFKLTGKAEPAANAILLPTVQTTTYGADVSKHMHNGWDGIADGTQPLVFVDPSQFWARVRQEIIRNPKLVAEMTGIEEIAYLANVKPPEKLPTFEELENLWTTHARCIQHQKRKVMRGWEDFKKTTGITTLTDITPEIVVSFQDNVHGRGWTGKQQQHLFAGIRRVLSFAKGRAVAVKAISEALTYISILTPSESATALDPKPISTAEFANLLKVATGQNRAMILLMLNCAMYLQDVTAVCICRSG
jgi:hypothetical protein